MTIANTLVTSYARMWPREIFDLRSQGFPGSGYVRLTVPADATLKNSGVVQLLEQ
jgi:hypothetical protein